MERAAEHQRVRSPVDGVEPDVGRHLVAGVRRLVQVDDGRADLVLVVVRIDDAVVLDRLVGAGVEEGGHGEQGTDRSEGEAEHQAAGADLAVGQVLQADDRPEGRGGDDTAGALEVADVGRRAGVDAERRLRTGRAERQGHVERGVHVHVDLEVEVAVEGVVEHADTGVDQLARERDAEAGELRMPRDVRSAVEAEVALRADLLRGRGLHRVAKGLLRDRHRPRPAPAQVVDLAPVERLPLPRDGGAGLRGRGQLEAELDGLAVGRQRHAAPAHVGRRGDGARTAVVGGDLGERLEHLGRVVERDRRPGRDGAAQLGADQLLDVRVGALVVDEAVVGDLDAVALRRAHEVDRELDVDGERDGRARCGPADRAHLQLDRQGEQELVAGSGDRCAAGHLHLHRVGRPDVHRQRPGRREGDPGDEETGRRGWDAPDVGPGQLVPHLLGEDAGRELEPHIHVVPPVLSLRTAA
jgi:hypothetical protein